MTRDEWIKAADAAYAAYVVADDAAYAAALAAYNAAFAAYEGELARINKEYPQ